MRGKGSKGACSPDVLPRRSRSCLHGRLFRCRVSARFCISIFNGGHSLIDAERLVISRGGMLVILREIRLKNKSDDFAFQSVI